MPRLPTALLMLLTACAAGRTADDAQAPAESAEPRPTPLAMLAHLPLDTETVFVAQGPYTLKTAAKESKEWFTLQACLEGMPANRLRELRDGAFRQMIDGQEVAFGMAAGRRFNSGGGLGMQKCEGCDVLVLRKPLGGEFRKALAAKATSVTKIEKSEVFVFDENYEHTEWRFFVAAPQPDILLCATNRDFLEEMLQRMAGMGRGRALPEQLLELQGHADTTVRFWAVRHYAPDAEPFLRRSSGLVFAYDPQRKQPPKVLHISNYDCNAERAQKAWTYHGERGWSAKVRKKSAGVIEVSAVFTDDGDPTRFLYLLLAHFGYVICC